jgi:hypothetical protein
MSTENCAVLHTANGALHNAFNQRVRSRVLHRSTAVPITDPVAEQVGALSVT